MHIVFSTDLYILKNFPRKLFNWEANSIQKNHFPVIDPVATGENILRLRQVRGLSVRDLQAYLGFEEPQAINKWQRGQSLPSVDNLYALGGDNLEGDEKLPEDSFYRNDTVFIIGDKTYHGGQNPQLFPQYMTELVQFANQKDEIPELSKAFQCTSKQKSKTGIGYTV